MSFLLDTDICSAYLKNDKRAVDKVMHYFGGLYVSAISVAELLTWAMRAKSPPRQLQSVREFLSACEFLEIDALVAEKFGELHASLLDRALSVGPMDILNAATALVHDITMVTHNTKDYVNIPNFTLVDWLADE